MSHATARKRTTWVRLLLLPANVLLAVFLIVSWADFMRGSDRSAGFSGPRELALHGPSSSSVACRFDAAGFASAMQPRRPVESPGEVAVDPSIVETPEWGPGGPLAREWEFASFVGTHDGRVAMVQLRRVAKSPELAKRPRLNRRSASPRRRPAASRSWTFFVADHFVKDETSGVDLVAHAADSEGFTYSLPNVEGGPWTLAFARPRSVFFGAARDGSVDTDVAPGFVPGDWRARREENFQRYLEGR